MLAEKFGFVFLLVLTAFSCKKETVEGPAGPQGPPGISGTSSTLVGTISGRVILYDSVGDPLTDNSGATISLDYTNPVEQGTSNSDGIFSVANVVAGNYDLSISKTGYGSMHILNFLHPGGMNPSHTGNIELGQKISSRLDIKKLSFDTASYNYFHFYNITVILERPQKTLGPVVLYFNSLPGVMKETSEYSFRAGFFQQDDSTLVYSQFQLPASNFLDKVLGQDYFYATAAIDNPRLISYTDSLGYLIYPCTGNLSNEVKVYNNLK
ncbi:MAG: carboxypeptidase-like regulatory domain-containing protein [Chitinophagales bacterium]